MAKGNKYKKFNACRPKRKANSDFKDGDLSGASRNAQIRKDMI